MHPQNWRHRLHPRRSTVISEPSQLTFPSWTVTVLPLNVVLITLPQVVVEAPEMLVTSSEKVNTIVCRNVPPFPCRHSTPGSDNIEGACVPVMFPRRRGRLRDAATAARHLPFTPMEKSTELRPKFAGWLEEDAEEACYRGRHCRCRRKVCRCSWRRWSLNRRNVHRPDCRSASHSGSRSPGSRCTLRPVTSTMNSVKPKPLRPVGVTTRRNGRAAGDERATIACGNALPDFPGRADDVGAREVIGEDRGYIPSRLHPER